VGALPTIESQREGERLFEVFGGGGREEEFFGRGKRLSAGVERNKNTVHRVGPMDAPKSLPDPYSMCNQRHGGR
jgi:hypothetical protein